MSDERTENSEESGDLGLKRWRACDDVAKVRTRVHRALRTAERCMYAAGEEGDREGALKAARSVHVIANTYLKILEADELEERIEALEQRAGLTDSPPLATNGHAE